MSWVIIESEEYGNHIMPEDEEHDLAVCSCGGSYQERACAFVHNSFDGREAYENGDRKPH
jgi:hypothetical protein